MQGQVLRALTCITHSSVKHFEGPQVIMTCNYSPNTKSLDLEPSLIGEHVWARLKNGNSLTVTVTQTLYFLSSTSVMFHPPGGKSLSGVEFCFCLLCFICFGLGFCSGGAMQGKERPGQPDFSFLDLTGLTGHWQNSELGPMLMR